MPNTRSKNTQTFSVSGQGLHTPVSSLDSLPINHLPYYTISLTNDNHQFYTSETYSSFNYQEVLNEYHRLIDTGVDKVFQISIITSHVETTYGGVVEDTSLHHSHSTPVTETETETEISLHGYHYTRYGKGFLLHPRDGTADQYYGQKYFLDGWWNDSQQGWFFRKDATRMLDDLGASFDGPKRKSKAKKVSVVDLNGYFYTPYGRGFMLYPCGNRETDPLFGQKYLLGGYWNANAVGWFFQTRYEDDLISHGAVLSTAFEGSGEYEAELETELEAELEAELEVESESEDPDYSPHDDTLTPVPEEEYYEDPEDLEYEDLDGMYFLRYGKGYILKTKKTDSRYGQNYFLDGFWNEKAKGWFFKREMKRFLKEHGAKYIKVKV